MEKNLLQQHTYYTVISYCKTKHAVAFSLISLIFILKFTINTIIHTKKVYNEYVIYFLILI